MNMPHASEMLTNLLHLPYKSLQKSNKKTWQSDEDELLLQLVEEYGSTGFWYENSNLLFLIKIYVLN